MAQTPPTQTQSTAPMENTTVQLKIETSDLNSMPKDKVLVQVNDVKITAGDLDMILKAYPENTRVYVTGPGRQQFFDQMVRTLVLAEEGKRRKLEDDPTYKAQAQYSLAAILANQTNEDVKKNIKINDMVLKHYMEEHQNEYTRLKARHILIRMKGSPVAVRAGQPERTEEEALAKAKELVARIKGGADFADLAMTESDDVTSGQKGGDLGVFGLGQMVPSFEEAAYKLKPGEVSDPVKSPFGFHIIQLQERQIKPFDELKPELEAKVRPELTRKQVEEMVNKAKVILAPEVLPSSKMAK
jgi:peptidyl-prolyl cis-trans isomerase C